MTLFLCPVTANFGLLTTFWAPSQPSTDNAAMIARSERRSSWQLLLEEHRFESGGDGIPLKGRCYSKHQESLK
jgi:hypothetical protein